MASSLNKSNKIFNKIFTGYRKSHIINILETFESDHMEPGRNIPLDMHIRKYYLKNKSITNIDREFINEQVYSLIKYKGLLDFLTRGKIDWNKRIDVFYEPDFESQKKNVNLPPHARVSYPKELFDLIASTFSVEKAIDYCSVMNERAPLTIRVNLLKLTREDLYNIFKKKGFDVVRTEFSPYGITFLTNPKCNFFNMEEFRKGYFEVQDEGSQLVSLRVQCKPGDIVLDYCGGSAGKSLAIAPFTEGKGRIFIHDIRKNILLEARKRLRRAGVQNYQVNNDKDEIKTLLKEKCDWVLCDVPCTGSGTFRRNPDLKWKFSLPKLEETLKIQHTILEEAAQLIKPRGKIVYVTCSLIQDENLHQVVKFCRNNGFKIESETVFQTVPKSKKMDGFFSVTLTR